MKLYYSPGAVSLVTHIALEELGLRYTKQRLALQEGEHLTPAYRAVNPLARVPALEIESGEVLTETPALLWYLSSLAPEAGLMPHGRLAEARANEWMSLLASAVHVHFLSFWRPTRFIEPGSNDESLKSDGKKRFWQLMQHVESRLPERGFVLGPGYSLVDAYVALPLLWSRRLGFPVGELPRYVRVVTGVIERPAVRRALDQEGLSAAYAPAFASSSPG